MGASNSVKTLPRGICCSVQGEAMFSEEKNSEPVGGTLFTGQGPQPSAVNVVAGHKCHCLL